MSRTSKARSRDRIRESFDLYTWGHGGQGALGNSAFRDELEPYLVSGLRANGGTVLVGCGFDHTIAVTGDMRARGWGRAAEGQLGLESHDGVLESPRGGGCVLSPALIGLCEGDAPAAIQAVACGGMHTLLMTMPRSSRDDPVVFSFGRGAEGQLGTASEGLVPSSSAAAAVDLPTELPCVLVEAGGMHSCALSNHGHVFIWGDGSNGQLGLSSNVREITPRVLPSTAFEGRAQLERKVPIKVSALEEGGREFTVLGRKHAPLRIESIACGMYHTVAITVEGELYSWGVNSDGQLGLDDTETRYFPSKLPGRHDAIQVACGGRHTIALGMRGDGAATVWSCGCNNHGQLGHGDGYIGATGAWRLTEVEALSDEQVVQISCGGAHTAAVTSDGTLYTWGKNHNGQLGLGHVESVGGPTKVSVLEQRAAWVACGGAHTACLVKLGADGVQAAQGLSSMVGGGSTSDRLQSGRSSIASSARDTTDRGSERTSAISGRSDATDDRTNRSAGNTGR